MERKDPNDMTAAELLRWAANGEMDKYGNSDFCRKLVSALSGEKYARTGFVKDLRNIRDFANQIEEETEAARMGDDNDTFMTILDRLIMSNSYHSRHEGEGFVGWIKRCFIPRPLDEDGEPVQFGDKDIDWEGVCEYRGQSMPWSVSAVNSRGHILSTTADPYKIVAVAKTDENGRVKRRAHEVLGGDGLPVVAGETVYTETGLERVVAKVGTVACDGMEGWDGTPWVMFDNGSWLHAADVTHTPPDTQERIDGDAVSSSFAKYWGCSGIGCDECPANIDGKLPDERYGTSGCREAMILDLLRRQRELDARKGGE